MEDRVFPRQDGRNDGFYIYNQLLPRKRFRRSMCDRTARISPFPTKRKSSRKTSPPDVMSFFGFCQHVEAEVSSDGYCAMRWAIRAQYNKSSKQASLHITSSCLASRIILSRAWLSSSKFVTRAWKTSAGKESAKQRIPKRDSIAGGNRRHEKVAVC